MASFIIVACRKCGGLLVAETGQKTRTCPYCGVRFSLDKAKRVAVAGNAREASMLLKKLKRKLAEKRQAK